MKRYEKLLVYFTSLALFILYLVSPVSAWQDHKQHKTNILTGSRHNHTVILKKEVKDHNGKIIDEVLEGAKFVLYTKNGEQIGDVKTTSNLGLISIDNLPVGEYYFEEVEPPYGYEYDLDKDDKPIKRYEFSIDDKNQPYVEYVKAYNRIQVNDLKVSKEVISEHLNETESKLEFTFKVVFNDGGTYSFETIEETGKYSSGEEFTLTHDDYIIFKDIPVGVEYQVEEINSLGYNSNTDKSHGVIENGKKQEVKFTNDKDGNGTLTLSKEIVNLDEKEITKEQKDKHFIFDLVVKKDDELVEGPFLYYITDPNDEYYEDIRYMSYKSGEQLLIKHEQEITFVNIPDGSEYTLREVVLDDDDFKPNLSSVVGDIEKGKDKSHHFINYFGEPIKKGNLEISKEVIGEYDDEEFEFSLVLFNRDVEDLSESILEDEFNFVKGDEEGLYKAGDTITLKDKEKIIIKDIPNGTEYMISESESHDFNPETKEFSGSIIGDETVVVGFKNIKEKKETTSIKVSKQVVGPIKEGEFDFVLKVGEEVFEFKLKDGESKTFKDLPVGEAFEIYEKDVDEKIYDVSISKENGELTKDPIEISVINYYKPIPTVTITGEKTWSFPEGVDPVYPKTITVLVKDKDLVVKELSVRADQNNEWKYSVDLPKFDKEGNEIEYTIEEKAINSYKASVDGYNIHNQYIKPAKVKLSINKVLEGDDIGDKDFIFEFEIKTDKGSVLPENSTAKVKNQGKSSFGEITFYEEGIYKYQVLEKKGSHKGITYDESIKEVEIEVVNKDNILVSNIKSTEGNELTFTNKYEAPKVSKPVEPPKKPEDVGTAAEANVKTNKWTTLSLIGLASTFTLLLRKEEEYE